jgi:ABC-type sugar transport system permease subunit
MLAVRVYGCASRTNLGPLATQARQAAPASLTAPWQHRHLVAWLQAAPLAAVFVVFFLVPLGLIVMVSFWRATDYELIPAFTLQAYARHFRAAAAVVPSTCVTLKTYPRR